MSHYSRTVTVTRNAPLGPLGGETPSKPEARGALYERIMQVSIKHTFYNSSGDQCRDFAITPTQETAGLMRSLGLLFKHEGAGFSVLYKKAFEEDLLRYLKRQANEKGQVWTRLSFDLTPINAYFVNRTEIPIHTDTYRDNFYFTNQQAHLEPGLSNPRLSPGGYVSAESRFDVVHLQVAVPVTKDTWEVRVLDISGEAVIRKPRCVPATGVLYLNMDGLRADRYTIQLIDENGERIGTDWNVVYEPCVPSPLCLIDLLFTNPDGQRDGIYPVTGFDAPINPVHYELVFERRSTVWNYYVIPLKWEPLEDLSIINPEEPLEDPFDGPCLVRLANGSLAYHFVSRKALPLEQQSQVRLQLRGRRASLLNAPGVLMERLPVASAEQVLPRTAQRAHSDIFVYV